MTKEKTLRQHLREIASARHARLTPEQRKAEASKRGIARWAGRTAEEKAAHLKLMQNARSAKKEARGQ
jgi:hypothetical protein